jgi:hypothetical protein
MNPIIGKKRINKIHNNLVRMDALPFKISKIAMISKINMINPPRPPPIAPPSL